MKKLFGMTLILSTLISTNIFAQENNGYILSTADYNFKGLKEGSKTGLTLEEVNDLCLKNANPHYNPKAPKFKDRNEAYAYQVACVKQYVKSAGEDGRKAILSFANGDTKMIPCQSGDVTWTDSGNSCHGTLTYEKHSETQVVWSNEKAFDGEARYTCDGGVWKIGKHFCKKNPEIKVNNIEVNCSGSWVDNSEWSACQNGEKTKEQKYIITQLPKNGGKACSHANGQIKTITENCASNCVSHLGEPTYKGCVNGEYDLETRIFYVDSGTCDFYNGTPLTKRVPCADCSDFEMRDRKYFCKEGELEGLSCIKRTKPTKVCGWFDKPDANGNCKTEIKKCLPFKFRHTGVGWNSDWKKGTVKYIWYLNGKIMGEKTYKESLIGNNANLNGYFAGKKIEGYGGCMYWGCNGQYEICKMESSYYPAREQCPFGSDRIGDYCEKKLIPTLKCDDGFYFDRNIDKCIKEITKDVTSYTCEKGVLEGEKCKYLDYLDLNYKCNSGTLIGTQCKIKDTIHFNGTCPKGYAFNRYLDACEKTTFIDATPYCFLSALGYHMINNKCVGTAYKDATPNCPTDYVFDSSLDKCRKNFNSRCLNNSK